MSLPKWANWMARDKFNRWHLYAQKPEVGPQGWIFEGRDAFAYDDPEPTGTWQDSLREIAHTRSAPDYLHAAAKHMEDRAVTYDQPEGERSMGKAVEAFNAITGRAISESEGWLLMQCVKNVRLFQRPGFHQDSAEDAVAYGALLAEAKQKEVA